MKQRSIAILVTLVMMAACAMEGQSSSSMQLMPEPKEVQLRGGVFRVRPNTRIVVGFGHQAEDRIAAETLAEAIQDESGLSVGIFGAKAHPTGKAIVLARLQDRRVRKFLASKGLHSDSIGDQGYVLFSDKSHLVVAANTGEGLFAGVQVLRQLLRPEGKQVICPAVVIRDWPSAETMNVALLSPHEV